MGKPSKQELDTAFQEAKRLIWQEQDQYFLAKSLFALNDKYDELAKVYSACDAYIRTGHSTTAHRKIISAINSYRNLFSENNADYVVNVTDEEHKLAIAAAEKLRESGKDITFLAKTVLNLNYLVKLLETVYRATERYLHSGMSSTELQNLEKAIKNYQIQENRTSRADTSAFGVF